MFGNAVVGEPERLTSDQHRNHSQLRGAKKKEEKNKQTKNQQRITTTTTKQTSKSPDLKQTKKVPWP